MGDLGFASVERSKFTTSDIEKRHQFGYFTEEVCRHYSRRDYENTSGASGFQAEIEITTVAGSECVVLKGPARTVTRSPSNIRADNDEGLYYSYVLNGQLNYEGPGGRWSLSTGQAVVIDNRSVHQLQWRPNGGSCKNMSIRLPRAEFAAPATMDRLADQRFFSQHKFSPLLNQSLRKLAGSVENDADAEIIALLKISETLIKTIAQDRSLDEVGDKSTFLSSIELEIEARLQDPDFSLSVISSSLNVSARQVQRAMAAMETTFSEYVRNKRLSMSMAQLRQPNARAASIESISLACGFSDLSTFYRAFKARYGCTPGDIRNGVGGQAGGLKALP